MALDVRMPKQTPEQKEVAQERRMQGLKDEQLKENIAPAETTETAAAEKIEYDPQYILQVHNLKKHFPIKGGMLGKTVGQVKAVDGVDLQLEYSKDLVCVILGEGIEIDVLVLLVEPFVLVLNG